MTWLVWIYNDFSFGHGPMVELLLGDLVIWAIVFAAGYFRGRAAEEKPV